MNKFRYIIQARMESKRLSGKVLMPVGEKPLVLHIIDRLMASGASKSDIVFALARENCPDLRDALDKWNISFFSGDANDVLSRYLSATEDMEETDYAVRITGDNPFLDIEILKSMIENEAVKKADLSYPVKLPVGMGFEVIRVGALRSQLQNDLLLHHKEHVSTYIRENPDSYKVIPLEFFKNVPEIRLTIDYPRDLEQAQRTYGYFSALSKKNFNSSDVYGLAKEQPDFFSINKDSVQRSAKSHERRAGTIYCIAASSQGFGSGHRRRLQALADRFRQISVPVEFLNMNDPVGEDASVIVFDARDEDLPTGVLKAKREGAFCIAVDNRGKGRDQADYAYDALPHPRMNENEIQESISNVLIDPFYLNSSSLAARANLSLLDKPVVEKPGAFIHRPGQEISDFKQKLKEAESVTTYFGQTMFEALYCGKDVYLYSISDYHQELALWFFPLWSRLKLAEKLKGEGYQKLTDLVLEKYRG